MFERFFPDTTVSSTYAIDYEKLYKEGYRGILFDIDNTLVEHGKEATEQAKRLFSRLKKIGYECCLISNNKKKRVHSFNEKIGVHTVFNAHKPAKKGYFYAMELMNTRPENTIFVGDQLFTDIFGAKRIGLKNFLVKPINEKEEIQIVLKRKLEKIVLHEYRAKNAKKRGRNDAKRNGRKNISIHRGRCNSSYLTGEYAVCGRLYGGGVCVFFPPAKSGCHGFQICDRSKK